MGHGNIGPGREKNISGGSGNVERHGSGLGTGPVGNSGGYSGRPSGNGGSRPAGGSGNRGNGRTSSIGGNIAGSLAGMAVGSALGKAGNSGSRKKSGCLGRIIGLILVLIVLSWLLRTCSGSGDGNQELQTVSQQTQETLTQAQTQTAAQTAAQTTAQTQAAGGQTYSETAQVTGNRNGVLNTEVRSGSRIKYTDVENAKSATVLVYICGSNLESDNGMGTSDLQEMIKAGIAENDPVNVLAYTGGASRWKNNVISAGKNQIYRVLADGLERLVADDGDKAMTDPETLASFITYGVTNYPADRYMLILWDHGAGSVLGYGYDENHTSRGYMSLASIKDALEKAGVRFDFVGYDACLMATVSNALMLSGYADYLIASEETEPGTGWYYTNWLAALKESPSMNTVELGKMIADDFTEASGRYSGSAQTTLSVTDLAELETFLSDPFERFSAGTNELLASDSYKTVSNARASTKEFAASEGLDQVDMIHFALNMGTKEGEELAGVLQSAVKYNRTSRGYEKAYGLSEYFPWHSEAKVDQALKNYDEMGLEGSYSSCIRTFANMQLSGQITTGGSTGSYGSMFGSLFGGNGYEYTGNSGYSGYGTYQPSEEYNGYFGGYGSADSYNGHAYTQSGSIDLGTAVELISLFMNRSTVADVNSSNRAFVNQQMMTDFSSYVAKNSINPNHLKWQQADGTKVLAFDEADWNATQYLLYSLFVDDGSGFIDLGLDNVYQFDEEERLIGESDGTWLSLNGQIVAYYFLDEEYEGEEYLIRGYIPALVNGNTSRIYVSFSSENPYGVISGYRNTYSGDQEGKGDKLLIFEQGDKIQPIADYYQYAGTGSNAVEYSDTYMIGNEIEYKGSLELTNRKVNGTLSEAYQITDIYGQRFWTEKIGD